MENEKIKTKINSLCGDLSTNGEPDLAFEIRMLLEGRTKIIPPNAEVVVKLADILKLLDDEEYTISVFGNYPIDDKIAESIRNRAIINFKQQLKEELNGSKLLISGNVNK